MAWAADSPVTLTVLGRSSVQEGQLHLSPADLTWLTTQKQLRVGTSEPDYPPFDITNHSNEFEGISADYLALIGQLLSVQIQVQRYPNRSAVIQALKRGDIDLLRRPTILNAQTQTFACPTPTPWTSRHSWRAPMIHRCWTPPWRVKPWPWSNTICR